MSAFEVAHTQRRAERTRKEVRRRHTARMAAKRNHTGEKFPLLQSTYALRHPASP
jgi:hypothetical protein